jgi:GH24 family phage-related lysozyme (muramidase)
MSATGKRAIQDSEGLLLNSYLDTANVWTIGFGHAATNFRNVRGLKDGAYYDGPVVEGVTITRAEALRLFESDIGDFEVAVSRGLNLPPGVELAQCQYDALCDHAFQFGSHNLLSSTLLMQVNANPNNLGSDEAHGIAWEFSRWNKVGGVPSEDIYRRSLRRAFAYAGQPVPAKLWSKGGIPWALDAAGHIDWTVTPTVYKVMADAKKAATKPTFEPEYPRKVEPTIIETPAVEISPPAVAKAEPPIQQPPSPGGSADPIKEPADDKPLSPNDGPKAAEREPAPSSVKVPAPPLPPKPPVIIAPKSIDVRSIPYGEIPDSPNVKNMTDSRRFTGMLIVGAGSLIQVLAARQIVSTAAGAIFFDLSRDPVIVAIIAGAIIAGIAELTKRFGTKRITTGMVGAKELLK